MNERSMTIKILGLGKLFEAFVDLYMRIDGRCVATRALFQPMEANPSDSGPQTTVKREEHKMRIEKMCVQSVDRK